MLQSLEPRGHGGAVLSTPFASCSFVFRIWGLGFRVWGLGLGLGLGV